jgi:prepilin-type N-terminal cleavage/methylation domain-containing protein/prepilin-type processing-associated H-X9-DG protein
MLRLRAFTLTELLVVLAILALLTSILVPTLSSLQRSGRVTACLGNLRGLQLASLAYAADHDGRLIDVGLGHGGPSDESIAWINTLESYYDHALVVRSPLDTSPHWPADQGGLGVPVGNSSDTFRRTSYGCNAYLSATLAPAAALSGQSTSIFDRLSRIGSPANTVHFLIMAFHGDYAASDHVHPEGWSVPGAGSAAAAIIASNQTQIDAAGGKTKSGHALSNYGFVDGHSQTLRFGDVYVNPTFHRFNPAVAKTFAAKVAQSNQE